MIFMHLKYNFLVKIQLEKLDKLCGRDKIIKDKYTGLWNPQVQIVPEADIQRGSGISTLHVTPELGVFNY